MKNIHILPTDKPSRLFENTDGGLSIDDELQPNGIMCQNINIYITNDEEIKEGDWYYLQAVSDIGSDSGAYRCEDKTTSKLNTLASNCKKIILTTDQDLIKDRVQAIDDEFLEWFVKNPSCEEVEVEPLMAGFIDDEPSYYENMYKIIIPKEELCEHFTPTIGCIKDVCSCNKDPKHAPFKHKVESLSTEEVLANRSNAYEFIDFDKQETLEEAAFTAGEESFKEVRKGILEPKRFDFVCGFTEGAKWQQEQDKNKYSEEEVKSMLIKCFIWITSHTRTEHVINWFEQNKKK